MSVLPESAITSVIFSVVCTLLIVMVAETGPLNSSWMSPLGTPVSVNLPAASRPDEIDVPTTFTTMPGIALKPLAVSADDAPDTVPVIDAPDPFGVVPGSVGDDDPPQAAAITTKARPRKRLIMRLSSATGVPLRSKS